MSEQNCTCDPDCPVHGRRVDPPHLPYDGPCPDPVEVTTWGDLGAGKRVYMCGCGRRGDQTHPPREVAENG